MGASVDNSVKASSAVGGTTLETASFAVGGNNRVLYALVGCGATSPGAANSVKWGGSGGTAMSQIGTTLTLNTNVKITLWKLTAPTAQTSTIYASYSATNDELWILGTSVQDADQTTPNDTVQQATGSDAAPTDIVTTVAGQLVLNFMSWLDVLGGGESCTSSQTSLQEIEAGVPFAYEGAGSSQATAGGSSQTMNWSVTNNVAWGQYSFAINDAPAGGAVEIGTRMLITRKKVLTG